MNYVKYCYPIVTSSTLRHPLSVNVKTRSTRTLENPIAGPERYARARLLLRRIRRAMAEEPDQKPLKEFSLPSNKEPHSSIVNPAIATNNFELKLSLVQIVQQNQFTSLPTENPNQHLKVFIQLDDTLKINGVSPKVIHLHLFPFSLPENSVITWNDQKKVFLARYFPPIMTIVLRNQINRFTQQDGESLFDAWEK